MSRITFEQIAGMNLHYKRFSFEYFLESMKRLGIKKYELWAGTPHFYNYCNVKNNEAVKKIRELNRTYGLELICVTPEQCIYPPNIAALDKELREYSVRYFQNYIEQTAELGAPRLLTSAGWGNYDDDFEESWKTAMESFGRLLATAEHEGIEIAFEILLPYESNLINNLETTKRILDTFNSPNMKCTVDTVPVCYEGRSLADYFEAIGDRITHIHLIDGRPDGHMTWGDGEQPLGEHLAALSKHDYSGNITLELAHGSYYSNPEEALKQSLDVLSNYLPYSV